MKKYNHIYHQRPWCHSDKEESRTRAMTAGVVGPHAKPSGHSRLMRALEQAETEYKGGFINAG